MDLTIGDQEHDELSAAVRQWAASKLYGLIEDLEPEVAQAIRDLGDGSAQDRIASTGLVRAYMAAVKDLGRLYQLDKAPAIEEEMIPASQLPMLVEKAVEAEVSIAVQEALEKQRADELEAARLSSDEAKAKVRMVLGQIAKRS